jgi:hypothetical protein
MPEVNGKHYRSFGQGYAAEKGKSAESAPAKDHSEPDGDEGGGYGDEIHVKHVGGGRFETKSKNSAGKITKESHDSEAELHDHMSKHFGLSEQGSDDDSGMSDGDGDEGMDALNSILG